MGEEAMTVYITNNDQIRYKLSIVGNQLIFQTNNGDLITQTGLDKGIWQMRTEIPEVKKAWWRIWE
jgi:hypothetical protein